MEQIINSSNRRSFSWWWVLVSLIGSILALYIVAAIGAYGFGWSGPKSLKFYRYIPLPAATVDWHVISYHQYLVEFQALKKYYINISQVSPQTATVLSDGANQASALNKLIRDQVQLAALKKLGISMSTADVDQAFQTQLLQNGNQEQVTKTINDLYGWTPQQFKLSIIRSDVARNKLQEKLSFDDQLNQSAKQQAEQVLILVKAATESFSDLAKKYSDDVYGANGGDIGFVIQGEQVKEIDEAAFDLAVGQTSDLVHSQYGYHIIKVLEKKTVNDQEQAKIQMITIAAPSVDAHINDQLKTIKVLVFSSKIFWDKEKLRVVAK